MKLLFRPCSYFADRHRSGTILLRNDLFTQHAKYCGTNCARQNVVGMAQNFRNMASTLPKTNTIKNNQVNKKDDPTFSGTDKEVELLLESVKIFKVNI